MYTYKLYFFVLYLLIFRSFVCFTRLEATTQPNILTLDLSNLSEHGRLEEIDHKFKLKETTFTTPTNKVVDKVVYDGTDVWVSSTEGSKVLKRVVLTHRNNIPQLLQLVVSSAGESPQEESLYYKKEKNRFTTFDQSNYTEEKRKLTTAWNYYFNKWYPLNFANASLYSANTRVQTDLEDGVWKYTYIFSDGRIDAVKDGTHIIWTHATHDLKSVQKLKFGNDNFLLKLVFGSGNKYFHKSGPSTTWQPLETESAFETKAIAFKSNYFSNKIDYDLSRPPSGTYFYVERNQHPGNYNELSLSVLPEYYLGHVKYKGASLWTAERDTRVLYLKLDLLYHEVKTFRVIHSAPSTGPLPKKNVVYFFKNNDGVFERVSTKDEFSNHVNKVKAAIDNRTPFVYNETWPSQPKPMDLNNFNLEDFDVQTTDLASGVKVQTLTAKAVAPFNGLNFSGVFLWPTGQPALNKPNITQVVLVTKNSLPQLVRLQATHVVINRARGRIPQTETQSSVDLCFQKAAENFTRLATCDNFEQLKNGLVSESQNYDTVVHLDLNLETLNEAVYEVNTNVTDGVKTKVVKPKANIQVTKLFSYTTTLWVRPPRSQNHILMKYELHSSGNKKLLRLYIGFVGDRSHFTEQYHEKRDFNVAWTKFTTNFNDKLVAFKSVLNLISLDLDVSVKPSLTDYSVEVNPLSGNKTKLVLAPVQGKKITKVKHGTHVFFTSVDNNRAYKVELYLEDYAVKFVKLFIWKDVLNASPLLTEEKRFKDVTASATTWTSTNFDEKLREFEATTSTVPFTYSPDWVLPSMTFDPKTSHRFYFQSSDQTEGLVTTTTYTPKEGTVVNNVLFDRSKVWPANTDGSGDPTKKLVELKVLSKNDMVQLLHLRNALVATPNNTEDLYYKKVMDTYEKLVNVEKFNELKETLSKADTYVDQNVKLDLSSTEETSTRLFDKETTLEDGVEKTVVVVKAGKLFQVSASPPLWTSTDGSYVTKLERYVLDLTQFLVLHITKPTGDTETKFYEKPVRAPEPPPGPSGEPSRPEASQTTEEHRRQTEQQQQDSQARVQDPPSTPSFSALGGIDTFVAKLNQAKAQVRHDEVPLDVAAYAGDNNFEVKEVEEGTTRLFKVYPKKTFWVTRLLNTSGVELWTKKADGERLVEVFLYLHDTKLKFVKAVVWPNNRTNASQDKLLHFKLENERLVEKTAEEFKKELEELTKVPPTPLSTEKYPPPEPTPYFFHKLYLSDTVDTKLFEFTERTAGAYKLKNYVVKQSKFVNAVETQHGLLWKAEDNLDHMKSTHFAVTENSALARLTLSVNSQPMDMFFKFEDDRWHNLDNKTYAELCTKAGVPSS